MGPFFHITKRENGETITLNVNQILYIETRKEHKNVTVTMVNGEAIVLGVTLEELRDGITKGVRSES